MYRCLKPIVTNTSFSLPLFVNPLFPPLRAFPMAINVCCSPPSSPITFQISSSQVPHLASPSTRPPVQSQLRFAIDDHRCRRRLSFRGLGGFASGGVAMVRTGKERRRSGRLEVSCGVTVIEQSRFKEEVLDSDKPVLVDFVADWCGPCRLIAPIVDWISEEYKDRLKVVKIDHDASPKLIETYKVYGLPTLIIFKDGQEVPESRREGAITKIKLKEFLDPFLEKIVVS